MPIETHEQLKQILTEVAKSLDEKVYDVNSWKLPTENHDIMNLMCDMTFERYKFFAQQHIAKKGSKPYVNLRFHRTNTLDLSTSTFESKYIGKILKKIGMEVCVTGRIVKLQTQPTEEGVSKAFSAFITSEREVYKAKTEYLKKLDSLVSD